jgi:hypothetical protein
MAIKYGMSTLSGTKVEIFDFITGKKLVEKDSLSQAGKYLGFYDKASAVTKSLHSGKPLFSPKLDINVIIKEKRELKLENE